MKPKISPDEYRYILESLELDNIYLSELKTALNEEFISQTLKIEVDEKTSFKQAGNTLKVEYIFKLQVKDEAFTEPAISLQAKYNIRYMVTKEVVINKEFMKIFNDLTVGMLLWPYFRELVNNTIHRMGMPSLVLPLKKR